MSERPFCLLERLIRADSFADEPANLADSPEPPMDAFSEVLSDVKLTGAVFFSAEFSAPWGFSTSEPKAMAAKVAPGAAHLVLYHLVIDGGAIIELADGKPIALRPGDVVVFPRGDAHHMSS